MRTPSLFALTLIALAALGSAAFTEVQDHFGTVSSGNYGNSVSSSGDFAVVGATQLGNSLAQQGAVEFWQRVDSVWTGLGLTFSPSPETQGYFGSSVSMSGLYCAIGARHEGADGGKVHMFKYNGSAWELSRTLTMSNPGSGNNFGDSVALENDRLVVGAPIRNVYYGAFRLFERDSEDDWTEVLAVDSWVEQYLNYDVALDGDYAIVSGYVYKGVFFGQGRVYVYKRSAGGSWDSTPHQTIENLTPAKNDNFGYDVSAAGGYLMVGAYGEDDGGTISGSVYFYELNTGSDEYELKTTYQEPGATSTINFGSYVSVGSDGLAVVGDYHYDLPNADQGRALMFTRDKGDGTWSKGETLQGSTSEEGSSQGGGVFYNGGVLIIGGYRHDRPLTDAGAVWFFEDPELFVSDSQELDVENPMRCGEYDEANQRYFYDDGTGCETTPTVNDACYYAAGDLVTTNAATLRVDMSELKADQGEDYIYLAFDLADKYYNTRLVFADAAGGACAHADWEQVSATRNVTSLEACKTTFVYRLA